jgi:monoamine oxidase
MNPRCHQGQRSRRDFLKVTSLAAAGMALAPEHAWASNGLERSKTPRKILVLGAGISGLVAAWELKRAGHTVTVLEATLRAGGRVHTLREPFADGLYAEAGAGRIPVTHTLTRDYAKRFGLTLAPYKPSDGSPVVYGAGRRIVGSRAQPVDLASLGMGFTAEEVRLGLDGMYDKYIGRFSKEVGTVPAEGWPSPAVRHFGNMSIRELMEKAGASRAAVCYLATGYEEDSALDFLRDAYSHEATPLDHIVGGNDLLPQAFARELQHEIIYGAPVIRIEQDQHAARAVFERYGRHETVTADRIICTLPFSTLRRVEISPAFSAAKRHAIDGLPYGSVTRVYLQYRRRFWLDEGCSGFADLLDLPMEIWNPTHDQPGQRGIHFGYMYERMAKKAAAMPEPARVQFFLDLMEKVFPGARNHVEGGTSFVWSEQPYQRGAYSVYNKGVYARLGSDVARAEGRIHFAGEHTSPWPAWIQGALYSGLRAARETANV